MKRQPAKRIPIVSVKIIKVDNNSTRLEGNYI